MPTALFAGSFDELGDPTDVAWAKSQLNPTALVHFEEVQAGHSTFLIGKNMTYFDTVMDLVKEHNPLS